jgi:hypothetical protein
VSFSPNSKFKICQISIDSVKRRIEILKSGEFEDGLLIKTLENYK